MTLRLGLASICFCTLTASAQLNPFHSPRNLPNRDSLRAIIQTTQDPIQKLLALRELGHAYYENKRDSGLVLFEQCISLARDIHSRLWEADACNSIGFISYVQGNYPRALQFLTQGLALAGDPGIENGEWKPHATGFVSPHIARLTVLARTHLHLGGLYGYVGNFKEYAPLELLHLRQAIAIATMVDDRSMMGIGNMNLARHYSYGTNLDSVLFYHERALRFMNEAGYSRYFGSTMFHLGEAYRRNQLPEKAKTCYWYGIEAGKQVMNTRSMADNALALAGLMLQQGLTDSAIIYGRMAAMHYRSTLILSGLAESYAALSSAFNVQKRPDSAYHYLGLSLATRKELDLDDKARRFQQINFDEQLKAQEAADSERRFRARIITYSLICGLILMTLTGLFLYRNNQVRKRVNRELAEKNRELEIEGALERVRSAAMAMERSDQLAGVVGLMYRQLEELDFGLYQVLVSIFNLDKGVIEWWSKGFGEDNLPQCNIIPIIDHPLPNQQLAAWKSGMEYRDYVFGGEEKISWEDYLFTKTDLRHFPDHVKAQMRGIGSVYLADAYMKCGVLQAAGTHPLSKKQADILVRFARVLDQSYTRMMDLQKAEHQAHQARIETALERVRARALAMQEPEELVEVAQLLRQEMGLLGIESLETGTVFIHDDGSERAECWFAIRDDRLAGKPLVSDHISLDLKASWVGKEMIRFFNSEHAQVSIPMQGEHRREWIEYCYSLSPMLNGYYGDHIPDRTYHLCKFSNGAIGAAAPGDISAESWDLLHRTASVFSLAYSRFKDLTQARTDLQRLKEEKLRAETALSELKETQAQLIQSEKLASLGQLTAGIAHEIQNPLNFVNNFSEINEELSNEILDAAGKGDLEEIKALAADIKSNQEKIREHGKRADSIVKGMLQHSRSSTGAKEPTDINKLAEEYIRLAYHGLRAKDKSFNANVETGFDPAAGVLNVLPQEIGRVLLNLINNAFYAVDEKSKQHQNGYAPTVSISTKRKDNKVFIVVKDNGNGIPDAIKDRIFQPFFTTKPTGQGTGLGLSLSYDIVKAHGGELTVETKEGEGSAFIIQL